jgi:hypothetical protein
MVEPSRPNVLMSACCVFELSQLRDGGGQHGHEKVL